MAQGPMYRQGDLLFTKLEKGFDADAMVPLPRRLDGAFVLALGEKTGHDHTITEDTVELYEDENGVMYARVPAEVEAEVKHQEHGTQTLPPGDYRVTQQQQLAGDNAMRVVD